MRNDSALGRYFRYLGVECYEFRVGCGAWATAPSQGGESLLLFAACSERAIRLLIALMVSCCDPLVIALTAATSASNYRQPIARN
jgi:hypothetical protein